MASRADISAGRAYVKLFLKNDMTKQLTTALRKMSSQLKSAGASMSALGASAVRVGVAASVPFALALRTFQSFDDQMRRVQAVTGATGDMFDQLTAKAKELGSTTAFTASQAADGMAFLGQAGFTAQQILEGIPAVLSLASAGAIELGEAADIASNVAGAFGFTADEIGRVADVMAKTAASANTNILELGEAFAKAAPAAKAAGQSIEEASAAIGILGDSGVKASVAGTDVKNILTEMAKRASIAGVATQDANGNLRDMLTVMTDIGSSTAGLSEAERLSFFIDTFGKRSAKSAIILTSANKRIDEMREKLAGAKGSAKAMADIMEGGIGGAWRRFKSAVEGVALAVGESLAPMITDLSKRLAEQAGKLTKWISANKAIIKSIFSAVIGFTAAGGALFALGKIVTAVGVSLGMLAATIAAVVSPIGLVTAALIAGTVAWAKYTNAGRSTVKFFRSTFGELKSIAQDTFKGIADAVNSGDLKLAAKIAMAGLKTAVLSTLEGLSALIGPTFAKLATQIISGDFVGAFQSSFTIIGEGFLILGRGIIKTFTAVAAGVVDIMNGMMLNIAESFKGNTFLEKVLGIDATAMVKQFIKKQGKGASRLGDAAGPANAAISGTVSDLKGKLASLGVAWTGVYDEMLVSLRSGSAGATDEISRMRADAEMELSLLAWMAAKNKKVRKENGLAPAGSPSGGALGGRGGDLGGTGEASAARGVASTMAVTFSAAAAIAAGSRGASGPESEARQAARLQRILMESQRQLQKEQVTKTKETNAILERLVVGMAYR